MPATATFDLNAFTAASLDALAAANDAHEREWHLGHAESWNVDQPTGRLVFSFKKGVFVTTRVQIVGTWSRKGGSFLWGWDHPSVLPPLQHAARRVREFGLEHAIPDLTEQKVACDEQRAWEFTALAMRLSNASGGYRGEARPGAFVFMTFDDVVASRRR